VKEGLLMYDALKSKNALYIEDESDVLYNISELLKPFFHTFYTASDGEAGYTLFQEKSIDVLLVDIELPKMNGIELIKKIRKGHKHLPIVVISAYTKTDYLLESIELHLDKYIVKPLTSRKIHAMLQTLNDDFSGTQQLLCREGVILDIEKSVVTYEGEEYLLTKREMAFMEMLCRNKMVGYDEMMTLWQEDIPSENAVRSFVKHLRKKLPDDFLKNRNSIGYYVAALS
jgi:DNA-binding response OmpR family regulator